MPNKKIKQAMDFNIELTEFPSTLHSHIYSYGRGILPLSRTLDAVEDPALRESCAALHGFVTDMLSDMYDHPEAYHLPVMLLEDFCGGKTLKEVKRQFPVEIKKVFSQISNAVVGYMGLLCAIGYNGKVEGDTIVLPEVFFKDTGKRNANRLEALNRVGFMRGNTSENNYCFISEKHSTMFPALHALADKPDGCRRFDFHNFTALDFRNIENTYKPTYDDYFYPLSAKQRERAYELHNFALEHNMRPNTDSFWNVSYHYKSKLVMRIGTDYDFGRFSDVRVIGKDRADTHTVIDKHLEKESQDFKKQALQHMTGCDTCQTSHCSTHSSGNYITVLGKQHQMCGGNIIGYDWREPADTDMAMIKRLIEIRCEHIDEVKEAKKAKK